MAIAVVGSVGAQSVGPVGSLGTGNLSVTTGNMLVARISTFQVSTYTVTDTQGNTYTKDVERTDSNDYVAIWRSVATATGNNEITLTHTGGSKFCSVHQTEASGQHATPFDTSSGNRDTDATTHTSGTATASEDGCLYLGALTYTGSSTTLAPSTGWTQDAESEPATSEPLSSISKVQGTAAALAASWTSADARTSTSVVAVYKAAGGGAATFGSLLWNARLLNGLVGGRLIG